MTERREGLPTLMTELPKSPQHRINDLLVGFGATDALANGVHEIKVGHSAVAQSSRPFGSKPCNGSHAVIRPFRQLLLFIVC